MPESEMPLQKAYHYAEKCYTNAAVLTRYLHQTLDALPEKETALKEDMTQVMEKAKQLVDLCEKLLPALFDLHVKQQSVASSGPAEPELPSEMSDLLQTLSQIERRRRAQHEKEE